MAEKSLNKDGLKKTSGVVLTEVAKKKKFDLFVIFLSKLDKADPFNKAPDHIKTKAKSILIYLNHPIGD